MNARDVELEEERLAKLGGYSLPFSTLVCFGLTLLTVLIGFAIAGSNPDSAMPFVFILLAFLGFFPMGIYLQMQARQESIQKRRELEANESSRRNYAHKKQEIDRASTLLQEGGLANLQEALEIYSKYPRTDIIAIDGYDVKGVKKEIAREKEKLLDYAGAIEGFEELGLHKDAKRARRKMLDEKKVDQTVIHGDYVDDRDTIIKDSVISKSSIGAGGKSKSDELRDAKALLDDGIIDDTEFKQMKKEILGK